MVEAEGGSAARFLGAGGATLALAGVLMLGVENSSRGTDDDLDLRIGHLRRNGKQGLNGRVVKLFVDNGSFGLMSRGVGVMVGAVDKGTVVDVTWVVRSTLVVDVEAGVDSVLVAVWLHRVIHLQ